MLFLVSLLDWSSNFTLKKSPSHVSSREFHKFYQDSYSIEHLW